MRTIENLLSCVETVLNFTGDKNMKRYRVYKITCLINNKVYIGQTYEELDIRFKRHISFSKTKTKTKFYNAIRKHGAENFVIEEIEEVKTQHELDEREYYWINYYDAVNSGYNTKNSIGKCGGDTLSAHPKRDQIRKKISKSKIGNKNPHSVSIKAYNVKTKEELIFNCIKDAQKYFNIERHDVISRRCRRKIKCLYNESWTFSYMNQEYEYNEEILSGGCCSIKVVDVVNKTENTFSSYTKAEKELGFPRGTINKKINCTKNPNSLYKEQFLFIKCE